MAEGFRTFDHTGDLGLEIWADTPERLFGLAAEALEAQVAEPLPGETDRSVTLDLEGDGPEDLLVHWLNTVLLQGELERTLWTRAEVSSLSPTRLRGVLHGRRLDPARQVTLREVKAVSHHALAVDLASRPCTCSLILDL